MRIGSEEWYAGFSGGLAVGLVVGLLYAWLLADWTHVGDQGPLLWRKTSKSLALQARQEPHGDALPALSLH